MKKLLIGLGILVVLVIAAAIIVPLAVPVDVYEGKLIALVKQSTGRDLKIGGPLKLSLLPRLALEADDVSFSNAPGAQAPQMAQLKQLQVQVQLLPLLHGAVVIDRFILVDPAIALEVDKSGRPNWVFGTAPTSPATPTTNATPAPASGGGASGLAGLRLDDVELTDGKISYFDARTGKTMAVDGINMKLSLPDLDQPFAANGSAAWNGEKVSLTVNIDKPSALIGGRQAQVGIKLSSTPISFSFAGPVAGMPPSKASGEVDVETKSLRDLATWLGTPIAMSGNGLGPLSIKGNVAMAGTTYSFSNADIALDAIKAKGGMSVDTGGPRLALKGQLDVDKLDVNPYLPPASKGASAGGGGGAGGGAPAAKGSGWSDAPIDVSPLKIADVDFDLKAGQILYRKFQIGQSALGIHLKDGHLTANLSQMALYQGTGHGTVTLDGSAPVPAISLNFALAQVQIEPLAEAAADSDRVTGTGSLDIAVTGKGRSQREIISALNGKGAVNLANGQIKGVNLLSLAQNATKSLTGGTSSGNTTDFGTLTGTYTITNGILKNTDLQLKSGAVPMTGSGTVDLPAQTIDYRVTPQLPGGIGVPIAVTGPWSDMSYRPDLAALLQGAAQEPGKLLDTLKSGGSSAGQGAGSLLKGLLGK